MRTNPLSILSIWELDSTIFNNLQLPEDVDSTTLINNLLYDLADFELLVTDPALLKTLIGYWSTKMVPIWERMKAACDAEYNPIENYDRTEHYEDTSNSTSNVASISTNTVTELLPAASGTGGVEHDARVHGNIGVTTNQQMLAAELGIAPVLNIYNIIIDSFKDRFCLLVY